MNCDFGALQNGKKLPLYFSMVIKKLTFDKNLKGNVVASNAQKSAEKRHLKWEEAKGQFRQKSQMKSFCMNDKLIF